MGKYLANNKVFCVIYVLFIKQEKVFSMHIKGRDGEGGLFEPTLSEKVGGAGRLFSFLRAWAPPLRGKYGASRAVVAILQILFLPKWFLDQRNHPWLRDDSLCWAI